MRNFLTHPLRCLAMCLGSLLLGVSALNVSAQTAPVGSWDFVLSGYKHGVAQITFLEDGTLYGQAIFTFFGTAGASNNAFGGANLDGAWAYDGPNRTRIKGVINEVSSPTGSQSDLTTNGLSFRAAVKPSKVNLLAFGTHSGKVAFKGVPLQAAKDFSGTYHGTVRKSLNPLPFFEIVNLAPHTNYYYLTNAPVTTNLYYSTNTMVTITPSAGTNSPPATNCSVTTNVFIITNVCYSSTSYSYLTNTTNTASYSYSTNTAVTSTYSYNTPCPDANTPGFCSATNITVTANPCYSTNTLITRSVSSVSTNYYDVTGQGPAYDYTGTFLVSRQRYAAFCQKRVEPGSNVVITAYAGRFNVTTGRGLLKGTDGVTTNTKYTITPAGP
jgi:hypothetical protein